MVVRITTVAPVDTHTFLRTNGDGPIVNAIPVAIQTLLNDTIRAEGRNPRACRESSQWDLMILLQVLEWLTMYGPRAQA